MSIALTGMSMRLRFILVIVATVLVAAVWYLAMYHPTAKQVAQVRSEVTTVRTQVASLEAQLKHLQELQRNEPRLRAKLARFAAALPSDPQLPQFILSVQDVANKAHVDFLTVSPSLPAAQAGGGAAAAQAAPGLKTINVSLTTTGTYFAVQNFIYRLETLDRAFKIDTFNVSSSTSAGGGSPKLSVSLAFRMFTMQRAATTPAGA